MPTSTLAPDASRWQRFSAASVRAFHAYAGWLVGLTWWRFALLSILLADHVGDPAAGATIQLEDHADADG